MPKTKGISPKLIGPFVAAITPVVTDLAMNHTVHRPVLAAALTAALGLVAAYFAPPGQIVGADEATAEAAA